MIDWGNTLVQIMTKDEAASVALYLSGIGCRLLDETAQEFASTLWEIGAGERKFLAFPFVGCNSRGVIDAWRSVPCTRCQISYAAFVLETTAHEFEVDLKDFV